jgi:outer membrane receptor for ferrienterochelin and colicin
MIKFTKLACLVLCTLLINTHLFAGTSSGIRGLLLDSNGAPIANQQVVVLHEPTGRSKILTTTENGIFQVVGLTVGGPYTVRLADGSSLNAPIINNLYLKVDKNESVVLTAVIDQVEDNTLVITGQKTLSGSFKKGPSAEFSDKDISNTAAISRDIKSILRKDSKIMVDSTVNGGPALSIAGSNIRGNSLTVDGVKQNDDFGLNKNGYPGRRTPISLDAIEQLEVNIAPFDVSYGDFQGGNINIVTKSGSNEFSGSAFYYRSDDSLIGDDSEGEDLNIGEFEEDTYGFTFGGPIIKDTLFFFASYDKFESTSPYQFSLDNGNGNLEPGEKLGVTQADFDQIAQIASDVWGYNIGGYNVPKAEADEKILIKLDWYINEDHRAAFTYQNNEGNTVRDYYGETFPNAPFTTSESTRYNQAETLEVSSLQLFSFWTEDFSTEVKLSTKEVKTSQQSLLDSNFEQMLITTDNGGQLYIGPDMFRHANELSNERLQFKVKGDYYLNDEHSLSFGWEHEELDIYNLFVFGSQGFVDYASVSDFENNLGFHVFQNALTGNPLDAVDEFQYDIDTIFLQDEWTISEQLTMTYGLRYSTYTNKDLPELNPNFQSRHGYSNQGNFDGLSLIEPRVGFIYDMDSDTVIRGGLGLFGGGGPNVWLSNSYGNDGRRKVFTGCFGGCSNGVDTPQEILDSLASGGFGGSNINGDTNSIHPDFEIPSVWKLNLGVDRLQDLSFIGLGDDWILSTEIILAEVKDAAVYRELNFSQIDTAPDGRPIYNDVAPFDLSLENTSKGSGLVWSLSAGKSFESAKYGQFDFDMGYTYQDITEVNPGNAFIAFEGYAMPANSDFQANSSFNSEYEVEDTIVANLTWSKKLFGDNLSTISLAYSGRTGRHFSHTMRTADSFGGFPFSGFADWDGFNSQSLYIPADASDPLVSYAADFDKDGFLNYIDSESCLGGSKGAISKRHSCEGSFINLFDIRFVQEIKFNNDHKIELIFDIENLGNLFNDDWGRVEGYNQPFNEAVVDATIVGGQYVYSNFTKPVQQIAKIPSVWKMQVGIRYVF